LEADLIDVLVVDDMPDAAESMAMALELDGYRVQIAHSVPEALAAVSRSRPLCVLLDISMPGMDGLDLVKNLRSRFGDDVVLVAITGASDSQPRVAETFNLVDHYFTKPADPAELRKIFPKQPHPSAD
jgi:DNA-binding response OmpR family regulator